MRLLQPVLLFLMFFCCSSVAALTISPSSLPEGEIYQPYFQTFTASGGTAPYTFAHTGFLSPGLIFSPAGVISGTPTESGTFPFTVQVTDALSATGSQDYTLIIASLPRFITPSLPDGGVNVIYMQTVAASGGVGPLTFSISGGSLPPGLLLSATGVISGTPTLQGTFTFALKITDTLGSEGIQDYSITIIFNSMCSNLIGAARKGDFLAMWIEEDPHSMHSSIRSSRRLARHPWTSPVKIPGSWDPEFDLQFSINQAGNAVAIWSHNGSTDSTIKASTTSINCNNWNRSRIIASISSLGQLSQPNVSIDQKGNAIAVWVQFDGSVYSLQAATLKCGHLNWQLTAPIATSAYPLLSPQIAINRQREAVAIWQAFDGSNSVIMAANYHFHNGWSTPVLISEIGTDAISPQLAAASESGSAVAVWRSVTDNVIKAATFYVGNGWSSAISISSTGGQLPKVAISVRGYTVVMWEDINTSALFSASSLIGKGSVLWTGPLVITNAITSLNYNVAINRSGNAVATWQQPDGSNSSIYVSTLPLDGVWSLPDNISGEGMFDCPDVAISKCGNAAIISSDESTSTVRFFKKRG